MMRKVFVKLLLFLPLILSVVALNIYIDPGSIVNLGNRQARAAEMMLQGWNVAWITIPTNWLEYRLTYMEKAVAAGVQAPDVVVFGSSRASEVHGGMFPGARLLNCCVPGGSFADYEVLLKRLGETELLPRVIILTFDPWGPLTMRKTDPIEKGPRKYLELLAPSYSYSSLRALVKIVKYHLPGPFFKTLERYGLGSFVLRSDGSYSLMRSRDVDPTYVANMARSYAIRSAGKYFGNSEVKDAQTVRALEDLIQAMKSNSIQPIFFLPPIHPDAYDRLVSAEKDEVGPFLQSFAVLNGIPVLGSFNPHIAGLDSLNGDFLDPLHPSEEAIARLFEKHKGLLSFLFPATVGPR